MHSAIRNPAAVLALAFCAAAQSSLPPGILLLARVKAHIKQELARLPNCSCLEIVGREFKPAGGMLRSLDVVRLEVLYSGGRELYASPGDHRFNIEHPSAFTGAGMIGNGYFALYLTDVTRDGHISYEYKGEEDLLGRRLAHYDFRLPVTMSGQILNLVEGSGVVGSAGSFWADPATFDIVRLELHATEIPPNLPLAELSHSVDYVRTKLGDSEFLLPRTANVRMVKLSGEESLNHIEFTQCHLYAAQSSIDFGMREQQPRFATTAASETERRPLPVLEITTRLASAITSETAVGSLIAATVDGNVPPKGAVLIPDGSAVRGVVRRLEWNDDKGGYYILGLEFTDIDAAGTRYRFYAELQNLDRLPGADFTLIAHTARNSRAEQSTEIFSLPDFPGVGLFFVRGRKLELPKGFRMVWKTRPLPH